MRSRIEFNPFKVDDVVVLVQHGRFEEAMEYTVLMGLEIGESYIVTDVHPVKSVITVKGPNPELPSYWLSHHHFDYDIDNL